MAVTIRSVDVFISFRFLFSYCGLYSTAKQSGLFKLKKILLILNIIVPYSYYTVFGIWLYIEYNFDITVVAQSFAIFASGTQGAFIYVYFLTHRESIEGAIDNLQDAVIERKTIANSVNININTTIVRPFEIIVF